VATTIILMVSMLPPTYQCDYAAAAAEEAHGRLE